MWAENLGAACVLDHLLYNQDHETPLLTLPGAYYENGPRS